jgi:hypothetical protein
MDMTLIETLNYFIQDQQAELQGLEWDIREETNQEDPDLDWYCNEYDDTRRRLEDLEKIKSIILRTEK